MLRYYIVRLIDNKFYCLFRDGINGYSSDSKHAVAYESVESAKRDTLKGETVVSEDEAQIIEVLNS